jgi:hypothetical protein
MELREMVSLSPAGRSGMSFYSCEAIARAVFSNRRIGE